MGSKKSLSIDKRSAIVTLRNEGYTIREIAKKLRVPKTTVAKTITKSKETGTNQDSERSGTPRVTTKSEDQLIAL